MNLSPRFFPELILGERKKRGLTQTEFGKLFGISKVSVLQWEKGTAKPKNEVLPLLAEMTGCRVIHLRFAKLAVSILEDGYDLDEFLRWGVQTKRQKAA